MEYNIMIIWLVVGVVLFVAEMVIPGIGFLFAGAGALTVGMLLNFSVLSMDNTLPQILVFVFSTAVWTVILWKPIQKLRLGRNKTSYNNIVGETAVVSGKGLSKAGGGEVLWSGANMLAKLDEQSDADYLEPGKQVTIKEIKGNILTVIPKL
jgi:membrane protein implicated in regulation of membrane protease activity